MRHIVEKLSVPQKEGNDLIHTRLGAIARVSTGMTNDTRRGITAEHPSSSSSSLSQFTRRRRETEVSLFFPRHSTPTTSRLSKLRRVNHPKRARSLLRTACIITRYYFRSNPYAHPLKTRGGRGVRENVLFVFFFNPSSRRRLLPSYV